MCVSPFPIPLLKVLTHTYTRKIFAARPTKSTAKTKSSFLRTFSDWQEQMRKNIIPHMTQKERIIFQPWHKITTDDGIFKERDWILLEISLVSRGWVSGLIWAKIVHTGVKELFPEQLWIWWLLKGLSGPVCAYFGAYYVICIKGIHANQAVNLGAFL